MTARVYPRPHGEAVPPPGKATRGEGLSPPTRGSQHHLPRGPRSRGSIPAHTGKPPPTSIQPSATRVYPRPHGEAIRTASPKLSVAGLSPPTRGSHRQAGVDATERRSIPAHTGKPRRRTAGTPPPAVYPRPHGEACEIACVVLAFAGLSPPTRGSRSRQARARPRLGSIPAHTGKPACAHSSSSIWAVYPRPHGEALLDWRPLLTFPGLSPPTRGSLLAVVHHLAPERSIPAHTGKPRSGSSRAPPTPVYPRPHGEAHAESRNDSTGKGLSPPTRGSRAAAVEARDGVGSIPAHTGKPARRGRPTRGAEVYPRPHGEAVPPPGEATRGEGLSPPTRGSPDHEACS